MILINDNYNGSSIWNINKEQIETWNMIELSSEDFEIIINTLDNLDEFYFDIKEMVHNLTEDLIREGTIHPINKKELI